MEGQDEDMLPQKRRKLDVRTTVMDIAKRGDVKELYLLPLEGVITDLCISPHMVEMHVQCCVGL